MIGSNGKLYGNPRPSVTSELREYMENLRYELAAGPKGLDGRIAPVGDEENGPIRES